MKSRIVQALIFVAVALLTSSPCVADNTDWDQPNVGTLYTQWPEKVKDLAKSGAMMSYTSDLNIPTNVIRYNRTTKLFEQYNGATWDPQTITGLAPDSVTTSHIANGTILDADIFIGANISGSKLVDGAVKSVTIYDGTIQTIDIGDAQVTKAKLASDVNLSTLLGESWLSTTDGNDAFPEATSSDPTTTGFMSLVLPKAGVVTHITIASTQLTSGTITFYLITSGSTGVTINFAPADSQSKVVAIGTPVAFTAGQSVSMQRKRNSAVFFGGTSKIRIGIFGHYTS